MHPLDDLTYVLRLDPKGMYERAINFRSQCEEALAQSKQVALPPRSAQPDLVMLTGLGGSAAGGDFVRALFEAHATIPYAVNRDYHLPSCVGKNSVVIACSYSGNTEETLSAYADAKAAGAEIICVTSGGKLAELAVQDGFPVVSVPAGHPPRTALGYLLLPVVHICESRGWIPRQDYAGLFEGITACIERCKVEVPVSQNPSKQLAENLKGKLSVLYGLGSWQGLVANRWKGQINENAKNMTFSHTFPELCHNEVLGWVKSNEQGVAEWVTVVLQDGTESPKMKKRVEMVEMLTQGLATYHYVTASGSSLLEKMLTLALYGDFVSLYLAALNGVDPENIDWLNTLKAELAKVG